MLTPLEIEALELSLLIGVTSIVASLPFALACAWLLARRDFWGKSLFDGVVHLPLVLPPVAVGFALLVLFGRNGVSGACLGRDGVSADGARHAPLDRGGGSAARSGGAQPRRQPVARLSHNHPAAHGSRHADRRYPRLRAQRRR